MSDHDILVTVRKWKGIKGPSCPSILKTRTFKNFDNVKFCNDLRDADWGKVINSNDIDNVCDNFTKITNDVTDMNAPLVTHRISSKTPPWITNELRKDIKERDFLKKKAVRSGCNDDWEIFKSKRNSVNRLKNDYKKLIIKNFLTTVPVLKNYGELLRIYCQTPSQTIQHLL